MKSQGTELGKIWKSYTVYAQVALPPRQDERSVVKTLLRTWGVQNREAYPGFELGD